MKENLRCSSNKAALKQETYKAHTLEVKITKKGRKNKKK